MKRIPASKGMPAFSPGRPKAARRERGRAWAITGLPGLVLLALSGIVSEPACAQPAGPASRDIQAGMAGGLASRDATLVRLDKGSGQLREIDLRGRAPGAAPALPAAPAAPVSALSPGAYGRVPTGIDWNMGVNGAIGKIVAQLGPLAADMVPCDDGAKPGDVLLKTAKSFLLRWCVKNRKTGSGAAPGKAAPDAKQRFDDYTKRCGGTIGEMAASIRRDQDGFQQVSPELTQRYIACSAGLRDLPAGQREWMERRLFIIGIAPYADAGLVLPCTGLALRADLIVTARHCFFPQDAAGRRMTGVAPSVVRAYSVSRPGVFAQASDVLDVDGASLSARSAADYDGRADIAFIRLAAPADLGNTANAQVAAALPDGSDAVTDLVVPGFHGELAGNIAKRVAQGGGDDVRYDNSGGCMMVRFKNASCYAHSCQTGPGVSGAPVLKFQEEAGGVRAYLLGIHTGAGSAESACQGVADKKTAFLWSQAAVNLAEFPVGKLFEK
jgi:hypothetical protein